ncbi:hypothetical protein M1271_04810 [Patescibacteria group bacterium]|nr:hypothetical protein [Patescibacteria group bacterium]MCL5798221.1 hypothetical protein [Patescibacteria group bacterium]
MILSSHRIRAEETKLKRRLILTILGFIAVVIAFFYAGLPILVKVILTFSTFKKSPVGVAVTENYISPPSLNPAVEATNTAYTNISGFADKEATVKIYVNGNEQLTTLTDNKGQFSVPRLKLSQGDNSIYATVVKNEKESSPSASISVSFVNQPPKLDISSPDDGQKFSSDTKEIDIIGQTDPNNHLVVNDHVVIVDTDGKFSYHVVLSSGENRYKIVATDDAGNKTEVDRTVNYNP